MKCICAQCSVLCGRHGRASELEVKRERKAQVCGGGKYGNRSLMGHGSEAHDVAHRSSFAERAIRLIGRTNANFIRNNDNNNNNQFVLEVFFVLFFEKKKK